MTETVESTAAAPEDQCVAAGCPDGCHYAYRMRGGAPIHVRQCMLCGGIDFDDLTAQARAIALPPGSLPQELRGDGPCRDCGTAHNIRWFTDNVLWNRVMSFPGEPSFGDPGGILCIPCFVKRVDAAGLAPNSWRLTPKWHWETKQEREARRSAAAAVVALVTEESAKEN